jgi:hypothetical protein
MKKLIALIALVWLLSTPGVARAQDEGTSSAETRRLIRERIEQVLQEKAPQEQEFIGVLGNIVRVATKTFTLVDSRGRERTVQVDDSTAFLSGKKTIKLSDLSINSAVAVIGKAIDEVVIDGRRVLVSDTDFTETRRVFIGTISQWNKRQLTILARGSNASESFNVSAKTIYQDSVGSAIKTTDIQTDQSVLIIAREDTAGIRTITKLRLLAPLER